MFRPRPLHCLLALTWLCGCVESGGAGSGSRAGQDGDRTDAQGSDAYCEANDSPLLMVEGDRAFVRTARDQPLFVVEWKTGAVQARIELPSCLWAMSADASGRLAMVIQDTALTAALRMYEADAHGYREVASVPLGAAQYVHVPSLTVAGSRVTAAYQRSAVHGSGEVSFENLDPCVRPLAVDWGADAATPLFAEREGDACVLDLRVTDTSAWWLWSTDEAALSRGAKPPQSFLTHTKHEGPMRLSTNAVSVLGHYHDAFAADATRASLLLSDDRERAYIQSVDARGASSVTELDVPWEADRLMALEADRFVYVEMETLYVRSADESGSFVLVGTAVPSVLLDADVRLETLAVHSGIISLTAVLLETARNAEAFPHVDGSYGRRLISIAHDGLATSTAFQADLADWQPIRVRTSDNLLVFSERYWREGRLLLVELDQEGQELGRQELNAGSSCGASPAYSHADAGFALVEQRLFFAQEGALRVVDARDIEHPVERCVTGLL